MNKHLLLHNEQQILTKSETNVCSFLENLAKTPQCHGYGTKWGAMTFMNNGKFPSINFRLQAIEDLFLHNPVCLFVVFFLQSV